MARTSRQRRGVLLLVVLSLLIVFLLIAVTFVVVANQQQQAAKAASRMNQTGTDPRQLADGALMQLLRDRPSRIVRPRSRIYAQSLLEDLYGRLDGFSGTIQDAGFPGFSLGAVSDATGGQFVDLILDLSGLTNTLGVSYTANPIHDYYNGCVLTILSGNARGAAARIVDYDAVNGILTVMFLPEENRAPSDLRNARFLVNSRQLAGTGIGYSAGSGTLDLKNPQNREYALMPNWTGYDFIADPGAGAAHMGGANESYDAADYQNVFLALEVPDPNDPNRLAGVIPSFHRPALVNYWMQREGMASLAQFANPGSNYPAENRDLLRRIMFRPNPVDHPYFPPLEDAIPASGSDVDRDGNGLRDAIIYGPWDVDNNGDGVRDSVWMDLGYPVVRAPDGRAYKPMFAILCTDLDGRFNLNAHGNVLQLHPDELAALQIPTVNAVKLAGDAFAISDKLPHGQGYGPPEIHMGPEFGDLFPPGQYVTRFTERSVPFVANPSLARLWSGPYGATSSLPRPVPGHDFLDPLAQLKFFEHPTDYYLRPGSLPSSLLPTSYSTPPDLHGRHAVGLDYRGVPHYEGIGEDFRATADSSYELNLSRSAVRGDFDTAAPADTPFTAAELERVLRAYDADAANLPPRLAVLWDAVFQPAGAANFAANRRVVTTDSFDLPVPHVAATEELRTDYGLVEPPRHIADLLAVRLLAAGLDPWQIIGEPFTDQNGDGVCDPTAGEWSSATDDKNGNGMYDPSELEKLLSPDLLMGVRMDVNRAIGNGRDNSSPLNGVVDERIESLGEFMDRDGNGQFDPAVDVPLNLTNGTDVNGDGKVDAVDQSLSRQLLARHLYVLAMLLSNAKTDVAGPGYSFPMHPRPSGNMTPEEQGEMTARRIAQWAINVVDFRDADAIMSPFEYDVNPFDGWQNMDGEPGTDEGDDRRLAWGCEYPHLLLTETCAFHDTRLVDSSQDNGDRKTRDEDNDPETVDDDDLDQYRIPEGSFFAELYCTGNPYDAVMPPELYTFNSGSQKWELELDKLAPPTTTGDRLPVWRLAISAGHPNPGESVVSKLLDRPEATTLLPNLPNDGRQDFDYLKNDRVVIERLVWFTTEPPATGSRFAGRTYYNATPGHQPRLEAGHYAVVGPRKATHIGVKTSGFPSAHVIQLDPAAGNDQVRVTHHNGAAVYPPVNLAIQPPVAIIAAGLRNVGAWQTAPLDLRKNGVNISEPLYNSGDYYPRPTVQLPNFPDPDGYATPYEDRPLDHKPTADVPLSELADDLRGNGTRENYKTVFLQRLANPLLPWNPLPGRFDHIDTEPVNPYITVDWLPVDLTVFNGEDHEPTSWRNSHAEAWNWPQTIDGNERIVRFRSRERKIRDINTPNYVNLWRPDSFFNSKDSLADNAASNHFRMNLDHTLGYLNDNAESGDSQNRDVPRDHSPRIGPSQQYIGDPWNPFPWLTWNDRPFVSQYELMMVPSSSPARLLFEYTMAKAEDSVAPVDKPYSGDTGGAPQEEFENFRAPFRYLFNFFHSSGVGPGGMMNTNKAAHLYRLLDYTHVPSRFVGTETLLNPRTFAAGPGTETFHPPFSKVSNYREPGKVNINTITSERVWQGGILHRKVTTAGMPWDPGSNPYLPASGHRGPPWFGTGLADPGLVDSRRGYGDPGAGILQLDPGVPTYFANPLRSATAGHYVPLTNPSTIDMRRPGIECTLLRSREIGDPGASPHVPRDPPLFAAQSNQPHDHTDRNPYFRYQSIQRLANLVTTRSNVFAVWVTVGYFEARPLVQMLGDSSALYVPTPEEQQFVYPDGYTLGPELGSDVGDVTRHRAFYIIDRSIPVAYEPGKNHNVENTILLRRFIE